MNSEKNLNECNGCLIINNNQNIAFPAAGKTNAYDINLEKPCFFINNHYITPLLKCYSVVLPNPVSLDVGDNLEIKIKIPKNIFGIKYGYSLENFVNDLASANFNSSLRLKSSDVCKDLNDTPTATDYCGWIVVSMSYRSTEKICNLCEISYSICFDPIKVKTLYGQCENNDEENVNFPIETSLLLTKNSILG